MPSPMMRMMKPTRYVPKDDIPVSGGVNQMHEQAAIPFTELAERANDLERGSVRYVNAPS